MLSRVARTSQFFTLGVRGVSKFAKSHEWIKVEGGVGTVGITDFAQAALGDVVFVGLPDVGATFKKGCVVLGPRVVHPSPPCLRPIFSIPPLTVAPPTAHNHPPARSASFATVESVKAASDVYAPVSGTVTEVNKALSTDSGAVNKSAESSAWFVKLKLKDPKELDTLLDAAAYKAACDAEKH
jgi:glycine cleavage system H protein